MPHVEISKRFPIVRFERECGATRHFVGLTRGRVKARAWAFVARHVLSHTGFVEDVRARLEEVPH